MDLIWCNLMSVIKFHLHIDELASRNIHSNVNLLTAVCQCCTRVPLVLCHIISIYHFFTALHILSVSSQVAVWLCMCRWFGEPLQSAITSDKRVWVWLLSESVTELLVCWTDSVSTQHYDQQLTALHGQSVCEALGLWSRVEWNIEANRCITESEDLCLWFE